MVQYINCPYIDKKCSTVETEVTNNYCIISSGVFIAPVNEIMSFEFLNCVVVKNVPTFWKNIMPYVLSE